VICLIWVVFRINSVFINWYSFIILSLISQSFFLFLLSDIIRDDQNIKRVSHVFCLPPFIQLLFYDWSSLNWDVFSFDWFQVICTISLFTLCICHNRLGKSLSTRKFPSQGTACFCLLMLLYSSIWAELVSPCWSLCCFPPNYELSMLNRDSYSVAVRSTLDTSRWVIVCTLILPVEPQSVYIYQLVIGQRMRCL
jgi:hypothetical protein